MSYAAPVNPIGSSIGGAYLAAETGSINLDGTIEIDVFCVPCERVPELETRLNTVW